jgi:pilus assembly protein Flp/PilA
LLADEFVLMEFAAFWPASYEIRAWMPADILTTNYFVVCLICIAIVTHSRGCRILAGLFRPVPQSPVSPVPGNCTMIQFASSIKRFLVSEDGPTAVEYAVMLALIIVVCLTAIQAVGTNAQTTFNSVAGQLGGS